MLEAFDFSNRRGVIAPMLNGIYKAISDYAASEKLAGFPPLPNHIIWKQRMRARLVDISSRWLFVMDGTAIAGLLFYRLGARQSGAGRVYVDELVISPAYREDGLALRMLLDKFIGSDYVKDCAEVFAGDRVRHDEDRELLASVGLADDYPDGYEPLGAPDRAADALRLRYARRQGK